MWWWWWWCQWRQHTHTHCAHPTPPLTTPIRDITFCSRFWNINLRSSFMQSAFKLNSIRLGCCFPSQPVKYSGDDAFSLRWIVFNIYSLLHTHCHQFVAMGVLAQLDGGADGWVGASPLCAPFACVSCSVWIYFIVHVCRTPPPHPFAQSLSLSHCLLIIQSALYAFVDLRVVHNSVWHANWLCPIPLDPMGREPVWVVCT